MLSMTLSLMLVTAPPLVTAEGLVAEEGRPAPKAFIEHFPFVGVQLDAGAPDGIGISLIGTPSRYVRVHIAALNNGLGTGARLGMMFMAFPSSPFRPLLALEGGYTWAGTGTWIPDMIVDERIARALTGVNLAFANLQTGFELGSKSLAITLRFGISYVDAHAQNQNLTTGANSSITVSGLTAHGFIPSARLGFLFFFD